MLCVVVGFFSGMISGMGIGGGAVLIPALIFLRDVSQQVAQGINLLYFLPTAAVSLVVHIKNKNVAYQTALMIGLSGILGACGGAWAATRISGDMLQRLFGVFLLFVGGYEALKGMALHRKRKQLRNAKQ